MKCSEPWGSKPIRRGSSMGNCNDEELDRAMREFIEASEEANKFISGVRDMLHQASKIPSLEKFVEVEEGRRKAGKKFHTLLFRKMNCPEDKIEEWLKKEGYTK